MNNSYLLQFCKHKRLWKNFHAAFLLLFLSFPSSASAFNIVSVQSINIKPYNDALEGYSASCNCEVERFILSEMKDRDVAKEVLEAKPRVILAIGFDALNTIRSIKNIPIVYAMVLNPGTLTRGHDNIAGVSMQPSPERQLAVIRRALPGVKSIGLLFDPRNTGGFVKRAQQASARSGLELIAREVRSSKDVPAILNSMNGKINALWMLPDVTVVTPETTEFLLLYSLEQGMPVITFSEKYLAMGALISLEADARDMGRHAWDVTRKVLSGVEAEEIEETYTEDAIVTVNGKTAKKLGVNMGKEVPERTKTIREE